MIALEAAQAILLAGATPLPVETAELSELPGRVLGETVAADTDFPPFARSRRDGYAIRSADTLAAAGHPCRLRVGETVAAGHPVTAPLRPGNACRVLTGAPLPAEADAVVADEEVGRCGGEIIISEPVPAGRFIEKTGTQYRRGEILLRPGTVLRASECAILAACGRREASVYCRPTAAVLATGDELSGGTPAAGQIRDSNSWLLAAGVRLAGGIPLRRDRAEDDAAAIAAQIRRGLEQADMAITTGGVGGGDCDRLPAALRILGARVLFRGLAIRPGTATLAAEWGGKVLVGLSGSPGAAKVGFELLAKPVLRRLAGLRGQHCAAVDVIMEAAIQVKGPLTYYIPVRVAAREGRLYGGRPAVWDSGNGLAVVDGEQGKVRAGGTARVILTGEVEAGDSGGIVRE